MFSHTRLPNPAPGPTSVRKLFFGFSIVFLGFLWVLLGFQWFWLFFVGFYWFFNGFLWFYNGFDQFLIVSICFPLGFALFWVSPLWFFIAFVGFRIGFERKTKGKLLENQSQPTPGPLRSFLLGLSRLCLLWGSFSGTSPESLLAGLLWAPLAGSAPLLPLSVFFYA